nr:unnamed protein product [Leishmania braziliensis]
MKTDALLGGGYIIPVHNAQGNRAGVAGVREMARQLNDLTSCLVDKVNHQIKGSEGKRAAKRNHTTGRATGVVAEVGTSAEAYSTEAALGSSKENLCEGQHRHRQSLKQSGGRAARGVSRRGTVQEQANGMC